VNTNFLKHFGTNDGGGTTRSLKHGITPRRPIGWTTLHDLDHRLKMENLEQNSDEIVHAHSYDLLSRNVVVLCSLNDNFNLNKRVIEHMLFTYELSCYAMHLSYNSSA